MAKKILLGLTTTPGSDWREKINEIDRFGIKEIALFPTYLKKEDREILYDLLEKTNLQKIGFTHLRQEDIFENEIGYLIKRYDCQRFNIHQPAKNRLPSHLLPYQDKVYIENTHPTETFEEAVRASAGLCIDFAHWEAGERKGEKFYQSFPDLVNKYEVGFAHISAVRETPIFVEWDKLHQPHYDLHLLDNINQMDYLKKYVEYLPDILGLELENSFEEQLEIRKYIEEIINEK